MLVATAIAFGVAVTGGFVARVVSLRRARHARAASPERAVDAAGVVLGAGPLRLDATGSRGVLLLHGFNDTPQSVAALARALHARGWSVAAPLLPGHGRGNIADDGTATADAWLAHARDEWRALRERVPRAVLCGQSMGGAIAVIMAGESPPSALVLLAPYLRMGVTARLGAAGWRIVQLVAPVLLANPRRGFVDESARKESLGGGQFTPRLVAELKRVVDAAWTALASVRVPTLVLHSVSDYRVPSESAKRAFAKLGSASKTLTWRREAGHVLAADRGREEVSAIVGDWLEQHVPKD